ncbi:GcrA family cell cycle regulator [Bradyrhizobium sp. CB1650]|uniref:GcrA family cell cycle regulator n=1 Tax=Bradyrhizobium sp. CB1650 TaxID=3039153 RepID=UPI00325FA3DE
MDRPGLSRRALSVSIATSGVAELERAAEISNEASRSREIARCVGIKPRLISLLELAPGDCRYPYGGDKDGEEITFCGHPRQPGATYCTPHFHLTRGPGTFARVACPVVLRLVSAA